MGARVKGFWRQPRFWLGMVSSVFFLWLVGRQVSWATLRAALAAADWRWALPGALLLLLAWALFAVRWRGLLRAAAPVRWADAFSYIVIGYFGNAVLPLRLGDIARLTLVSRRYNINVGFAAAVAILEKLLDIFAMLGAAALVLWITPLPATLRAAVQVTAAGALAALVVLALLARSEWLLTRLSRSRSWFVVATLVAFFAGRLKSSLRTCDLLRLETATQLIFRLLRKFAQGLQVLGSPARLAWVAAVSLASWTAAWLSVVCYSFALRLQAPLLAPLLVLVVINLGGGIPSSPGSIGVFEFLTVLALSVWRVDSGAALGFAAVLHVANLALIAAMGLVAVWREGVQWGALGPGASGGG